MNGQIITEASRQWMKRPDDERFLSLGELRRHVQDRTTRSRAIPSHSHAIRALPTEDGDISVFTEAGQLEPTNWSFGQLCSAAKAPAAYMRELPAELACINLQWGMEHRAREENLILHEQRYDGADQLRALTSGTYGRIWDLDVIDAVISVNQDGRWRVPHASYAHSNPKRATTLYASDRDVFIFLVDPERPVEVDGEAMFRGFYTWNSEVGSATFGLACFLYRYVCDNRLIWGAKHFREMRIRHTSGGPGRFLLEAEPRLREYANESTADVVQTIKRAKALELGSDDDDVKTWLRKRGFTGQMADRVMATARAEEGRARSLMDIVNGVTAYARSIPNADQRVSMEREAGKLMDAVA